MIEELKKNLENEIRMLREISIYSNRLEFANEQEKRLLLGVINSLKSGMKIINASIPEVLNESAPTQKLPTLPTPKKTGKEILERVEFKRTDSSLSVVLSSKDKERFIKELSIAESFLKKLKKRRKQKQERFEEFKASRGYLRLANKYFLEYAKTLIKRGYFKTLSVEIRRANIDILFDSYVALILLTVFLSFIVSIIVAMFFLFFQMNSNFPFLGIYGENYLFRFLKLLWMPFIIPTIVFGALYFYPSTEKKSIGGKVDQELPFAVIHMSAISGSGIAPVEIFKIIGLNKEYPNLRKEIRKVLNQINLYGYDLVTALNNAAKTSPSEKLSELFAGLSTSITSGASLSVFFEKRSEGLLLGYRLEREKYTKLVETFLDIYISVVITAPLIFLLLLVMIAISGVGVGFTTNQLGLLSVLGVAMLNVLFLVFLQIKQPVY